MNEEKEYLYPSFIYKRMIFQGLFMHEWIIETALLLVPIIIFGSFTGLLFSFFVCPTYFYLIRRNQYERRNLFQRFSMTFTFTSRKKVMKAKPRSEEEEPKEMKDKNKRKKKQKIRKQSWASKKVSYIQDHYPFKSIEDGQVNMENGDVYLFFKINSNSLDLLSRSDIDGMIADLSRDTDRNKFDEIAFFIQDSVFSLNNTILQLQDLRKNVKVPFVRKLMEAYEEYLLGKKDAATKKSFYIHVKIRKAVIEKNDDFDALRNKIMNTFKNSISLSEPSRKELKQMMAIFANRIFSEDFPDTEVDFEDDEKEYLLKKKKISYEYQQLPGIYNFKDLIVPATRSYNSKQMMMGRNIIKTYAVKSFIGSTRDTNLFSDVCSLKGVTTKIYLESLSTKEFKSSLRLDLKSKKSNEGDELDAIDTAMETNASKGSYKRVKDTKQKMYYITVYFMITAKTESEFDEIQDQFLDAIDDISVTLDPLQSEQLEAFQCVNPLGTNLLSKWVKQNIPSESWANLYPFNEPSLLDDTGMYIGNIANKSDIVLFDPFIARGNKNILVLGASGIGKTVLVMKILENEIYQGTYVRNIDVEGTYNKFFERLGGVVIDVAGNNDFCINPLQIRLPDEIKNGIVSDYISEVKKWISIYKQAWTETNLDLFERYLTLTYKSKGFTDDISDLSKFKNTDYPILSDVTEYIEKELEKNNESHFLSEVIKSNLELMLLGLESATTGADAKLFNRHTYLGDINDVQTISFDMKDLMDTAISRKLAQWSNIFSYITQFVNQNMDQSKRIMISIDELHELLKPEYLSLVDIINSCERRFRKSMASLLKATQTIDEINSEDPILAPKVKPLFSQSTYKFLFHLGDINYDVTKNLLNLKDVEINKLKEKRKGQCLFRVNNTIYDLQVDMPEWYKTVKADVK